MVVITECRDQKTCHGVFIPPDHRYNKMFCLIDGRYRTRALDFVHNIRHT